MDDPGLTLAGDFPKATREDWLRLVEKVLKGADPGKRLVRRTHDGIGIQPVYTRSDQPRSDPSGWPGQFPFIRGAAPAGRPGGWEIRQRHNHPDPQAANATILEDLRAGADTVALRIDTALTMNHEPPDGCCVLDIDDLALAATVLIHCASSGRTLTPQVIWAVLDTALKRDN